MHPSALSKHCQNISEDNNRVVMEKIGQAFVVRLKFQKRSELKFVSRTIPQSGGCNTTQLAVGFHTRDYLSY
jgi:hypothetical protein